MECVGRVECVGGKSIYIIIFFKNKKYIVLSPTRPTHLHTCTQGGCPTPVLTVSTPRVDRTHPYGNMWSNIPTTFGSNCQYLISFIFVKSYEFFCFKQNICIFLYNLIDRTFVR